MCVTMDTRMRLPWSIPPTSAVISSVALLFATTSSAAPIDAGVTVLAIRESRVYLEVLPSAALQNGLPITFLLGERTIATAVITRIYDSELAVATLSSGSLTGVANVQELRVTVDHHPTPPALLRVGYPSSRRATRDVACRRARLSPALETLGYRAVSRSDPQRLVRDTSMTADAPWPDTLVVRFFDEAADQEIALERGELDVAVFWPGELSKHMRESARFRDLAIARNPVDPADPPAVEAGTDDGVQPRSAWPVVCGPEIRPVIEALGRGALADLIVCDAPRR